MKRIVVAKLKSNSPISFGRYYEQEFPKDKKNETDKAYEERTWRERVHTDGNGNLLIPPFAFKNCLDGAAKYTSTQIPGKGKATYTKHFRSGVLVLEPLVLPIKKADVKGEWRHVPSDGTPGGAKRVMKCFPVIPSWEGEVTFTVLDPLITTEILKDTLIQAGQFIGVGSFRPQNGGIFGRFTVESIKEI